MAKWIKVKTGVWFNAERIQKIDIRQGSNVYIEGELVAEFRTYKEAEKFIQDFIDEHYIQSGKIQ